MKAIRQTGARSVDLVECQRPSIGSNEVLVRVHASGVCGSDAHAYLYHGGYEWVSLPRIMGHEYAGKIVEVGSKVSEFAEGDFIVEEPTLSCGQCFQCKSGQSNVCQNFSVKGMHRDGSYATYTTAVPENIHLVPDGVSSVEATITEPLSVATHAVFSQSTLTPGDTALVQGPGPIGVLVASIAHSMGARVLVSGLGRDSEYRLPLVRELGINTVNLDRDDLASVTDEFTDSVGFDFVFDTTGHHTGVESAIECVRKGGQVVVVGLPGDTSELQISDLVRAEIDLNTSYGSEWKNFEEALQLLKNNVIDTERIIDTSFSVKRPEKAFDVFLESKTCKPILDFSGLD